jgi:hypothetical protein
MLTADDCDAALEFLHETCEQIADAKAELERSDILRKRVRRKHFLTVEGTVAEREARADSEAEVQAADDRYIEAIRVYEGLKAKRELRVIQVEVWRTTSASKRAGAM